MGFTKIALKRPVSVLLILFAVIVFGVGSIFGFKMSEMPNIETPTFIVSTIYSGADPELVDTAVSAQIEAIGAGITGFSSSMTNSSEGMSMVIFRFDYGVDRSQTYMDLKTALDTVKLPEDASTPVLTQIAIGARASMSLSVTGEQGEDALGFVKDIMVPELSSLPGVAEVSVAGGTEQYISVTLDPTLMEQYGVTTQNISSAISSSSFELPIGEIEMASQSISVGASASIDSLAQLSATTVATSVGTEIPLEEVASVSIKNRPADSISRYNGESNISLSITAASDADIPELCAQIESIATELQEQNSAISIVVTQNESEGIYESLSSIASTLLLGVFFCMLVLFAFFGNIRASLIVGSSIPVSLVCTLICMSLCGFELNIVTTTALVIAIGMMVDNSIVVLESIFKSKSQNGDFAAAAFEGCKAVGASVVASTITTIVVYLPMATLGGMTGELFSELAMTIVFAMLASLIAAVILIPLFYFLLKPSEKQSPISRFISRLEDGYSKIIPHVMHKKKRIMLLSIVLLFASFVLAMQIPLELMPSMTSNTVQISAQFRSGTGLEEIDKNIAPLEQMIADDERITQYSLSVRDGNAIFEATVGQDYTAQEVVDDYLLSTGSMTNMSISVSGGSASLDGSSDGVQTTVFGSDYDAVKAAASDMTDKLYAIPGVLSVSSSSGSLGYTKGNIEIDPELSMYYGLSPVQVSTALRQAVSGTTVGTMVIGTDEYSVVAEYPQGSYDDFNSLMNFPLTTKSGTIPLSEIAEITFTDNLQTISRQDNVYSIELTASTTSQSLSAVIQAMSDLETAAIYPNGVQVGDGPGGNRDTEELLSLAGAIATAIFLVFIVMAVQFESVRFSLMVMTSVLLSFIGSFGLLYLSGQTIGMISLMGMLMLMGIVVNNGILFVDTANELKKHMPVEQALAQSGKMRLRPILMTTLTTVLSMVPLALGIGEGAQMLQSMGIIIIGGLVTSTVLVLFLMPTFYLLIGGKKLTKSAASVK